MVAAAILSDRRLVAPTPETGRSTSLMKLFTAADRRSRYSSRSSVRSQPSRSLTVTPSRSRNTTFTAANHTSEASRTWNPTSATGTSLKYWM